MGLYHLIDQSRAVMPFTDTELAALLLWSRTHNRQVHVTGLLLHAPDVRFLQILEGEDADVRQLYYEHILSAVFPVPGARGRQLRGTLFRRLEHGLPARIGGGPARPAAKGLVERPNPPRPQAHHPPRADGAAARVCGNQSRLLISGHCTGNYQRPQRQIMAASKPFPASETPGGCPAHGPTARPVPAIRARLARSGRPDRCPSSR
ncbi:BLUF domain-containing protein [Hymenobacter elongatus]|uniref:BLUF domain-containing protein n=1 Tax=Hymenobacter elongatus TaxID=877208 RepID=A0A4Z0PM18_9BACT|nr:BLUF domain-containing protein [Hymenobacter elongatus]